MEFATAITQLITPETFASDTGIAPRGHLTKAAAFLQAQRGFAGAFVIFVWVIVFILLPLVLWAWALYLSYNCGIGASQALAVTIAFFFPIFYLTFFLIYHTLLGNKC